MADTNTVMNKMINLKFVWGHIVQQKQDVVKDFAFFKFLDI